MADRWWGQAFYPSWRPSLTKDKQTEHELIRVNEEREHGEEKEGRLQGGEGGQARRASLEEVCRVLQEFLILFQFQFTS